MHIRSFDPADEAAVVAHWQRFGLTRLWNDPRKDVLRKRAVQPDLIVVGTIDGRIATSVMIGYEGRRGCSTTNRGLLGQFRLPTAVNQRTAGDWQMKTA